MEPKLQTIWFLACVVIACSGSPSGRTGPLRVVFDSPQKVDGTDALNTNDPYSVYGTYNIWRVNADGTGLTPLTNATSADASSVLPQWSPDGSKLVFNSSRKLDGTDASNPAFNIWRMNADGTGLAPLTRATAARADSAQAQWSPDGTKAVFVSRRNLDGTDAPNTNSTYNIWRVNADGTGLTPLTNLTAARADSAAPQWSPDGSKVVFDSSRRLDGTDAPNTNLTSNIWLMNADGTGLASLTTATALGVVSFEPRWSPDGSKVVFRSTRQLDGTDARNPNLTYNIWRVNADGTGLMPLTRATANGVNSEWASFSH